MIFAICLTALVLIACAATIYRLSGEKEDAYTVIREQEVALHYLRERNKQLNGELLTASRTAHYGTPTSTHATGAYNADKATTALYETRAAAVASLPTDHPQKRKPKSIRAKRKP